MINPRFLWPPTLARSASLRRPQCCRSMRVTVLNTLARTQQTDSCGGHRAVTFIRQLRRTQVVFLQHRQDRRRIQPACRRQSSKIGYTTVQPPIDLFDTFPHFGATEIMKVLNVLHERVGPEVALRVSSSVDACQPRVAGPALACGAGRTAILAAGMKERCLARAPPTLQNGNDLPRFAAQYSVLH